MSETIFRNLPSPGPFAFFQDIFARKRANEQQQFLATILQHLSESIIVTNLQGNIIYWNEGATAYSALAPRTCWGKIPPSYISKRRLTNFTLT